MIDVQRDAEMAAESAARRMAEAAQRASAERGRFCVALAGGSTPRRAYELLAAAPWASQVDWACVHVFWGDERCVPPEDGQSNYRMARLALLDRVGIPAGQIHRIEGERGPIIAADEYELVLRREFAQGPPYLDFALLGLGDDGHTASLFPGGEALREATRWAAGVPATPERVARVTLTLPFLNRTTCVAVLVTGSAKADRLREVVNTPPGRLPAQLVRPASGQIEWIVDRAAAAKLT